MRFDDANQSVRAHAPVREEKRKGETGKVQSVNRVRCYPLIILIADLLK
jgi:hypothetical protein